jgi:Flp pilus assembly protein TadG
MVIRRLMQWLQARLGRPQPQLTPVRVRAFRRDERGGTAIQALVFVPLIIFALVVGSFLMQTLMIRRSLHTGTYLATRYLSLYPPDVTDSTIWSGVAQKFVWAELKNNPFVDPTKLTDVFAPVVVTVNDNTCESEFTIDAAYTMWVPIEQASTAILPGLQQIQLSEHRNGKVVCGK